MTVKESILYHIINGIPFIDLYLNKLDFNLNKVMFCLSDSRVLFG